MTILLDTSVLIDQLRGDILAMEAVANAAADGERVICSVVTKVEVLAGMRREEERKTRRLFEGLEWIDVDDQIVERAGLLANQFQRSHSSIDPLDFVIAATAERHRARLWTRNRKHFPMFENLVRPY
ncbi:type II toxin-antitoxin system VapC family toxin [soil metagenome]